MDNSKKLKLCDFGCSFQFLKNTPKVRKTFCGTIDYMAPEFFRQQPHGMPADVWALGILVYEMVHSQPPFDTMSEGEKVSRIIECDNYPIPFRPGVSPEFESLIRLVLRSNPRERPSFDSIFAHPWVRKYETRLNINIERLRFKDAIVGEFTRNDNTDDYFLRCELRPTEMLLYADESSTHTQNPEELDGSQADIRVGRSSERESRSKKPLESASQTSSIKLITARMV